MVQFKGNYARMKNAFTMLFSLVLGVCLTLYGPFGMVKAGGAGALFSMEICANGVVTTVLIGADGSPVEPAQDCPECLTCCHATGAVTPTICGAAPALVVPGIETAHHSAQDPILKKQYLLPAPRGPPAVRLSILDALDLIAFDQPLTGHKIRSDGRPLFKDADA